MTPLSTRLFGRYLSSRILLMTVTTVIALGCAEVTSAGIRSERSTTNSPSGPKTSSWCAVRRCSPSNPMPRALPGNVDMKRTFPYRTNSHGLRDRDRPQPSRGRDRGLRSGSTQPVRYVGRHIRAMSTASKLRVAWSAYRAASHTRGLGSSWTCQARRMASSRSPLGLHWSHHASGIRWYFRKCATMSRCSLHERTVSGSRRRCNAPRRAQPDPVTAPRLGQPSRVTSTVTPKCSAAGPE